MMLLFLLVMMISVVTNVWSDWEQVSNNVTTGKLLAWLTRPEQAAYGLEDSAFWRAAVNFAVAIICIVLVMRAMVLTAPIRFLISRI